MPRYISPTKSVTIVRFCNTVLATLAPLFDALVVSPIRQKALLKTAQLVHRWSWTKHSRRQTKHPSLRRIDIGLVCAAVAANPLKNGSGIRC